MPIGSLTKVISDFNDALDNGIYNITSQIINGPVSGASCWGVLVVFKSNNYIAQIFINSSSDVTASIISIRIKSDTWGTWKQL